MEGQAPTSSRPISYGERQRIYVRAKWYKVFDGAAERILGLFMALQEKIIACGAKLTLYGMFLRFIFGPFTVAIASFVVGLRGNVLRIAILQAALPQSVTSFVWAKEYELHADVLSTAVIFGTIMSLPLLIALYGLLNFIP